MAPIFDHYPILLETDSAKWCEEAKRARFKNFYEDYQGIDILARLITVHGVWRVGVKPLPVILEKRSDVFRRNWGKNYDIFAYISHILVD